MSLIYINLKIYHFIHFLHWYLRFLLVLALLCVCHVVWFCSLTCCQDWPDSPFGPMTDRGSCGLWTSLLKHTLALAIAATHLQDVNNAVSRLFCVIFCPWARKALSLVLFFKCATSEASYVLLTCSILVRGQSLCFGWYRGRSKQYQSKQLMQSLKADMTHSQEHHPSRHCDWY